MPRIHFHQQLAALKDKLLAMAALSQQALEFSVEAYLGKDIALCNQTYRQRVPEDVRERFDYLYDELLRQLAEGDAAKLGPDAPKPGTRK